MRFGTPLVLVGIVPAVALVLWVARRGHRTVSERQFRVAKILRVIGVVLLIAALAQPTISSGSDQRTVVFLLDRSASVGPDARAAQESFVREALGLQGALDRSGVAVFGADVKLDSAIGEQMTLGDLTSVVDASATDIGSALVALGAVLPTEGSRRIVLITDGVDTAGNAREVSAVLGENGVVVDVVQLTAAIRSDVLIRSVKAPATARVGDNVSIEIEIESSIAGPAIVTVDDGSGSPQTLSVDLVGGTQTVTANIQVTEPGFARVKVTIETASDSVAQNNVGEAGIRVLGSPSVWVVEGKAGDADQIIAALSANDVIVKRGTQIPSDEALAGYDGVVLVNVVAPAAADVTRLTRYVEDLGRGLVVVGGDQAFGLGGYQQSALEDLLPVISNPDDFVRRQPVAEVLVIDTSGSMADCHCGDGNGVMDPGQEGGGVNKTDISRAGAELAIGALRDDDRIGVLAFTSGTRWALPFGLKPDDATVKAAVGSLRPEGDTEISQALEVALAEVLTAPEEIKHLVLFTDGWGEDPELLAIAQKIANAGVTLSVLATGEGTGTTLRRLAGIGGGQYYPGRDLQAIPEIFVEETLRVSRPLVAEGVFLPTLGAVSAVTKGLTSAPPLGGYVLTKAKSTAAVALEIGPGDPLLASWRRGLGRVSVWASDATTRWSDSWVAWEGYAEFWTALVRDTLPGSLDASPSLVYRDGKIEVTYTPGVMPSDAVATAQVRAPSGELLVVPLSRSGNGEYSGAVRATESGAYWVAVSVSGADGVLAESAAALVAPYSDEFAFRDPDPTLLPDITELTDGRVDPTAAGVWDLAPQRGTTDTDLAPLLVLLALVLFFADVVLRRLVVQRGDAAIWKESVSLQTAPVEAIRTDGEGDAPTVTQEREIHSEEETLGQLLRRRRKDD
ncbi:MAG: VWA domain-containing protein [Acidobacteria bacterium]|nr:VWA domain-containing protein [Acidobacteriota bacterium]